MADEVIKPNQREDLKIFFALVTNGIIQSIPFGVTVDPINIANSAKNVAIAMIQAQEEAFGK